MEFNKEKDTFRLFSGFCGYGTDNFALKSLGINYKLIGYSDVDKFANQCFKQNHCKFDIEDKLRFGDITKINPKMLPDFDLFTFGHPCQSYSNAGKRLGMKDPRAQVIYSVYDIIRVKKPKYLLGENVKGLLTIDNGDTFENIMKELTLLGYYVDFRIFNTKEHGIPQNRERVFYIGIRKDLDVYDNNTVTDMLPLEKRMRERLLNNPDVNIINSPLLGIEKEELKIFLKDILEKEVDDKYYLSKKQTKRLLESTDLVKKFSTLDADVAGCMTARQYAS